MQTRTLYALLATGLLLGTGGALAQMTAAGPNGDPAPTPEPTMSTAEPQPAQARHPCPIEGERAMPVGPIVIIDRWEDLGAAKPRPDPHPDPCPEARPEPRLPPRPTLLRLFAMIQALDARVDRLEAAHRDHDGSKVGPNPPTPTPRPTPAPSFRMTLSDSDVEIAQGGRRVAVLLQSAGPAGYVPLSVRSDGADGWTYTLELGTIDLDAHGRAWTWLEIVPGETGTSSFTVFAGEPSTAQVAQGTATAASPRIA